MDFFSPTAWTCRKTHSCKINYCEPNKASVSLCSYKIRPFSFDCLTCASSHTHVAGNKRKKADRHICDIFCSCARSMPLEMAVPRRAFPLPHLRMYVTSLVGNGVVDQGLPHRIRSKNSCCNCLTYYFFFSLTVTPSAPLSSFSSLLLSLN